MNNANKEVQDTYDSYTEYYNAPDLNTNTCTDVHIETIRQHVSQRGQFEMLAEECSEAAKAAMKAVRVKWKNDTYPVNPEKYSKDLIAQDLQDEILDVVASICILYGSYEKALQLVLFNQQELDQRLNNMVNRIKECNSK